MNPFVVILCSLFWMLPLAVGGDRDTKAPDAIPEMPASRAAEPAVGHEQALASHSSRLRKNFDIWIEDPAAYRERALRECGAFPEGRIYPFAIPALAYANLGIRDAELRRHCASQMEKLIDLLISTVTEDIRPPGGDLTRLDDYQRQGTRLATLNLTLACHALLAGDGKYDRLHDRISTLLRKALIEKPGEPLHSYPEYTWYFDTIPALVSLDMYDRAQGTEGTKALIEEHFAWLDQHAIDAATGLPVAYSGGLPRGCDLSMQVCLLRQMNARVARRLYNTYVRHHWVDLGVAAGFREWPHSKGPLFRGDIDSGPLLFGIGPTATGVGIGAAKAAGDTHRLRRLAGQLDHLPDLMRLLEANGGELFSGEVKISSRYLSGFLYGDAVLFYAMTWVSYGGAAGETGRGND